MTIKERIERITLRFSEVLEYAAIVGLLLIMVITTVDVVGAKVFQWRVFGAIDIVMLSQIVAISFSGGVTLIAGRHIAVEFFLRLLPRGARKAIGVAVSLMLIGFCSMAIWRLVVLGCSFQRSGEHSATAYIPLFPFAYAIALGLIPFVLWGIGRILEEGGR